MTSNLTPEVDLRWKLHQWRPVGIAVVALGGSSSVVPLLAWSAGLGGMREWFVGFSLPLICISGLVALLVLDEDDRRLIAVAVVAGIVGTVLYDLFRVPFVAFAGMRLMSAIQSYGVLLLDSPGSRPATDLVGWLYHFVNGIGFAVTYAVLAARRHWVWAVAWALTLESAAVFSPYGAIYQLEGNLTAVAIAYLAHVPYGVVLGLFCSRPEASYELLRRVARFPAWTACALVALWLVGWASTWTAPERADAAAVVTGNRLVPEFVRADAAGCATVRSDVREEMSLQLADTSTSVAPGGEVVLCVDEPGVYRIRIDGAPLSGGFLIRDPN